MNTIINELEIRNRLNLNLDVQVEIVRFIALRMYPLYLNQRGKVVDVDDSTVLVEFRDGEQLRLIFNAVVAK